VDFLDDEPELRCYFCYKHRRILPARPPLGSTDTSVKKRPLEPVQGIFKKQKSSSSSKIVDSESSDDSNHESTIFQKQKSLYPSKMFDSEISDDSDSESASMIGKSSRPHAIESQISRTSNPLRNTSMSSRGGRTNRKSFSDRMHQLAIAKVQNLKTKLPFQEMVTSSQKHPKTQYCLCVYCQKPVRYDKLDTLNQHLKTKEHQEKATKFIAGQSETLQILNFLQVNKTTTQSHDDHKVLEMNLCKALLLDNIPFNFMRTRKMGGLVDLLNTHGIRVVEQNVRGSICNVLDMELARIKEEVKQARLLNVIFDATPNRGEAFGVVLRWVDYQFKVQHRCIYLKFFDDTFDGPKTGAT